MSEPGGPAPVAGPPVAALVLGAAVWPGERPSPSLERRARKGAALWREGTVRLVIGCGGTGHHPPSEAEMIARICRAEGLPDTAIRREACSSNTLENIRNALPLLERDGIARVVIVTDRYHAPRARLIARRLGLDCTSAPAPSDGSPRWKRLRSTLREVPALLYYGFWPGAFR